MRLYSQFQFPCSALGSSECAGAASDTLNEDKCIYNYGNREYFPSQKVSHNLLCYYLIFVLNI